MLHEAASTSFMSKLIWNYARNLINRHRERRQINELMHMSDALLRDIGLTRYDVQEAMRSKGGLTPTAVLSRVSSARGAAEHVVGTIGAPGSVSETYLKAA